MKTAHDLVAAAKAHVQEVSVTAAEQAIRDADVLVDVREADEFAAGHVVGAKHVPLDQLEAKLASVVKNKATPLVLVCASGMRSKRALAVARKLGFENVRSLSGGMGAWRAASLPVEKT